MIKAFQGSADGLPYPRETGILANAENHLKNIATALEMWYLDNDQHYPDNLQQLVPNYLRAVPFQLDGGAHWGYQLESGGGRFRLSYSWSGFEKLGISPHLGYTSEMGLEPVVPSFQPIGEQVRLAGPWLARHSSTGGSASWERFGIRITARLLGPQFLQETVPEIETRLRQSYADWGHQPDTSPFAQTLRQGPLHSWTMVGSYAGGQQPQTKTVIFRRGEIFLEMCVLSFLPDMRDGGAACIQSLLSQI